jgi:hypothetical protein
MLLLITLGYLNVCPLSPSPLPPPSLPSAYNYCPVPLSSSIVSLLCSFLFGLCVADDNCQRKEDTSGPIQTPSVILRSTSISLH